jgi:hypothetical protein
MFLFLIFLDWNNKLFLVHLYINNNNNNYVSCDCAQASIITNVRKPIIHLNV